MAVTVAANVSMKPLYQGVPANVIAQTLYTAPGNTTNVPSGSPTAIVRDIVICNRDYTTTTYVTVTIAGVTIINQLKVGASETIFLSDLNIMMSAGEAITGLTSSTPTSFINLTISGWEVQ